MKAFWRLYKKDLESIWLTTAIFTLAIAAWDLYLYVKGQSWGHFSQGLRFGLSMIPIGFILLWIIWEAIQTYRHEWQTGGVYTMLSLPQPGWKLALSKLAAVLSGFTLQSIVSFLGSWILFWSETTHSTGLRGFGLPAEMLVGSGLSNWLAWLVVKTWVAYWLLGLTLIVVAQSAFVMSKLAMRFQFLVLLAGFVVSQWLLTRLGALGHYALGWLPDLAIRFPKELIMGGHAIDEGGSVISLPPQGLSVFVDSGPLFGWLLGLAILFIGTAWLLQNATEV